MAEITVDAIKPWEQQPDEGPEAFEAFDTYAKMGPTRSLERVATELDKSFTLMGRWSSRHAWTIRANAWDRSLARITNQKIQLGTAEMRARLITQATNIQARAANRILNMSEAEINRLKPSEVVAMIRVAADIEMKARTIPSSELEETEDRVFAPIFTIEFIPTVTPDMVTARLSDGSLGYITRSAREAFLADNPGAQVLD
jgi:hypothetical protein